MNNRFTFKDFLHLVLMVAVIIVLLLAMQQYDRQYQALQRIESALKDQTNEISQLRRTIQSGVRISDIPTTQSVAGGWTPRGDFFKYEKAAQQRPHYASGDSYVDAFPVKVPILTPHIV